MNKNIRKDAILAMEKLVRCINNEEIIESWLMCGIPDGDIRNYTREEVDDYFTENENFSYLITLFLKLMTRANKNGNLYIDGVTGEKDG